jgi:tyrosyl-tRNA synthetase
MKSWNIEKSLSLIKQGTSAVIPEQELIKKLESGKKLKVKLGMDPTAPDLHLGHAIVLSKLRQFQDLGHEAILIIGDFTALIGDPTGKSKTRPPLSPEQIAENTTTYLAQAAKILDEAKLTVRHNAEWLGSLNAQQFVQLCSKVTVAQLIEREDFATRLAQGAPVSFHELLYPIMQGYDSVMLEADVELGGTDQTFNLLMGRHLQEAYGQEPQVIITTPLLEGLSGVHKMSKSLGNYVGLTEPPAEAFGKIMSISDLLMWHYYKTIFGMDETQISALQEKVAYGTAHPMELKKELAHAIIARFWSLDEANKAREQFEAVFQHKDYSQATPIRLPEDTPQQLKIVELLKLLGAVASSSEARRLIEAGAVKIDGSPVTDIHAQISWQQGTQIRVGKHRIYHIE